MRGERIIEVMSVFVSRAVSAPPSQDRADIFARGEAAVLVVADGAGGTGDGAAAAELVLERVREAVLDVEFDLLTPARWTEFLRELGPAVTRVGESTVVIVVLVPGMLVWATAGDSEAWLIGPTTDARLTEISPRLGSGLEAPKAGARGGLSERLVVGTDGLFRHAPKDEILRLVRTETFWAVADALVTLAGNADDVAVLVAEP
jgi:serine/threonine protein phosphatase PrpC